MGEEVGFEHLIMVNQRLREEKLRQEIKGLRQMQANQQKESLCWKYVPWIVFTLLALGLMALAGFLIYEKLLNKETANQLLAKESTNIMSNK